jgi:HAE1 family hydrophobic/amphiphilic exporter-1
LAAAVFFSLIEAILFLTVRLAYTPETHDLHWSDLPPALRGFIPSFRQAFGALRKPMGILGGIACAVAILVFLKPVWLLLLLAYPVALGLIWYLGRIVYTFLQALTSVLHRATEWVLGHVREAYVHSMKGVLRHATWILLGVAVFFIATILFVAPPILANMNLVPSTDNGTMQANLRMPDGTPVMATNQAAGRIEAWLMAQPEVSTVQTSLNAGNSSGVSTGAQMTIQLVPIEKRAGITALALRYRQALTALIADVANARVNVSGGGGFGGGGFGGGGGNSTGFNIISADRDILSQQNQAIIQFLQNDPEVQDVTSSLSNVSLVNNFIPDPDRLTGTGLSPNTVGSALQTYASGSQASNVMIGGLSYPIQVMLDPALLTGGQSLLSLPIYAPGLQTSVPIGQLGSFHLNRSPTDMTRFNRQYSASINVALKPGGSAPLAFQTRMTKELTDSGLLGNGVFLTSSGRFSAASLSSQLGSTLLSSFALAMFMVYLVMGAQFNSWKYPIYLLLPVPLAIIGALWMVFALGGGLDIFGLMGMLMLIGLSAKNAIIYLDFVVERLGKMPFAEALIESARLRFRPIVMTTMTVLVISFPLIFGTGQGSEFGQKMGVVMFGGIMSSALLTFFVVPAAFYHFERKKWPAPKQGYPITPEAGQTLVPPHGSSAPGLQAMEHGAPSHTMDPSRKF